ncbi:MAG: glucose-6-phosphate isomerase [Gammaproteobacteria bacterium]|jgi:glucose-6-phosphate isomerase|nr:glucose-6-phosphate isomerase [Gammaproteobacteria bacterium]
MFGTNLLSKTPQWPLLKKEAKVLKPILPMHPLQLEVAGIHCELSHNYINNNILTLLAQLCQTQEVMQFFQAMRLGEIVNLSENRPALHTALRDPNYKEDSVRQAVAANLFKMQNLTEGIHQNKMIRHIVHIGIGGSDHGPKFIMKALAAYQVSDLSFHFIANIDPTELQNTLKKIEVRNTLFIVSSKSFSTDETLTNFTNLCLAMGGDKNLIESQCIAITANKEKALTHGFKEENILLLPESIGGRFSIWSAIGFSLMLAIGAKHFQAFLAGAKAMDEGCSTENFLDNPALLLAAMDCWYTNFLEASSRAILVYSSPLNGLIDYLQQLIMESNGKSQSMQGKALDYQTSPIIWGGVGSNSQHTFQQLLMQGTRLNPIDIILPRNSDVDIAGQQGKLVAHCLAQAEALILARNRQGQPYHLLSFEKISPHSMGALLALYEHRTVMSAALWAINPFDQFGVQLGKNILAEMQRDLRKTVF